MIENETLERQELLLTGGVEKDMGGMGGCQKRTGAKQTGAVR